jgi:uncharacterized membrane protein YccC
MSTQISARNHLGAMPPKQVARVRVGVGIVLLAVMGFLYVSGHYSQWAWLLAAGAALHFYLAFYRLRHAGHGTSQPARLQ